MRVNVDKILNSPEATYTASYNQRDLLLYAVGIGESALQFTYECHDKFSAFPIYSVCLPFKGQSQDVVPFPPETFVAMPDGMPNFNPAMILHGEQSVEIVRPLDPMGGTLTGKTKIISFYDKGKGTLLETQTQFEDANGPVAKLISGSFIRGLTGYEGSKGRKLPTRVQIPKRQPDFDDEFKTSAYQAQIYRLSGDYNSLHIDPEIATSVGYKQPILHGLCSMGVASRALYKQFCSGDATRFNFLRVRFSSPCYPGETIQTRMWQEENGKVLFQAVAKERGVVIIDNATERVFPNFSVYGSDSVFQVSPNAPQYLDSGSYLKTKRMGAIMLSWAKATNSGYNYQNKTFFSLSPSEVGLVLELLDSRIPELSFTHSPNMNASEEDKNSKSLQIARTTGSDGNSSILIKVTHEIDSVVTLNIGEARVLRELLIYSLPRLFGFHSVLEGPLNVDGGSSSGFSQESGNNSYSSGSTGGYRGNNKPAGDWPF